MLENNKKFYILIAVLLLLFLFLYLKSSSSPGSVYAPDMAYSKAYETYDYNGPIQMNYHGKTYPMSAILPVSGTVSAQMLPPDSLYQKEPSVVKSYLYTRFYQDNDADKARAGVELKNPIAVSPEVLARGQFIYEKQCLICHGKSGAGDGPLLIREDGSDGAYKSIPPNYSDKLKTLKDGEIYHTIVYGKNDMGGYATHIKPEDRWKLIHYIKKLGGVGETNASAEPMTSKDSTQTK